MQTTQGNRLHSLQIIHAFLTEHAERLSGVAGTGARRQLDELLDELSAHVTEQSGNELAMQGATRKLHALRRALIRDHMTPISTIARSELSRTPEIEPFHLPRGNPTVQKLAAAASGMAQAAAPRARLFIGAGLPVDFIKGLTDAADAMVEAANERLQYNGKRRGATKGLKTTLATARRIVNVLDAFVASATHDDPALLANWQAVRRVRRVAGRPSRRTLAAAAEVPQIAAASLRLLPAPSSVESDEPLRPSVEHTVSRPDRPEPQEMR
jgi:hypothetical protein